MADRDDAHLMLLAGIIMVLTFVVTALTLLQLRDIGKGGTDPQSGLAAEWRFVRQSTGDALYGNAVVASTNATVRGYTNSTFAALSSMEAGRGYVLTASLAGSAAKTPKSEIGLTLAGAPRTYSVTTYNSTFQLTGVAYDGIDDGLIFAKTCRIPPGSGCVQGVYVYLALSAGRTTLDETLFYGLNAG